MIWLVGWLIGWSEVWGQGGYGAERGGAEPELKPENIYVRDWRGGRKVEA